jgi:hypothetical protein
MRRSMQQMHEIATMITTSAGEMFPASPSPSGYWPAPQPQAMAG